MRCKFFNATVFLVAFIVLVSCSLQNSSETQLTESDRLLYEKADKLINQMTFEEKIGQMSQRVVAEIDDKLIQDIKEGKIGSILVTRRTPFSPSIKNKLQKIAVEESRLGIPIIFGHDVIHGFKTIFPTSLAQSCTWDTALVKQGAAVAAKEASAYGIDWTFAPMIDVSRDARWGRIAECFGEDAWLNSCFGVASVKGFQGDNVGDKDRVVACLKHFVGYGVSLGGRDYQYTDISDRTMHEVYLPPFKACVDAGVLTVMSGFNDINGIPASANKKYLTNVLKDEWGFPGFVVSDWDAIEQLIYHGYASDSIDAVIKAFDAGIDMEMKSEIAYKLTVIDINEKVLNDAVRRILFTKLKKGQFENPYVDESRAAQEILTNEHRQLARKIAAETMVLLENKNHVLPILNSPRNIAVIGPFANEKQIMGWWSSFGREDDVVTAFEGIKNNAPDKVKIYDKVTSSTDIIIVCVGEEYGLFGENHSRETITLPGKQSEIIQELKKHGKPIVTVVFNGRPLALASEKENSDALLLAWHPGTEGGNALADVLFGKKNPSGKLTASFPSKTGHIPVFYNDRNSGRPGSNFYMKEDYSEDEIIQNLEEPWNNMAIKQSPAPLYPFGYGLSYTTFLYSDLKVSETVAPDGNLKVSAKITNTGKYEGTEVVQLFIRDLVGSTTRPIKELKGFKRINLQPGESTTVSFIVPTSELAVLNEQMKPVVEKGDFKVWIASCSDEGIEGDFEIN